MLESQVGGPAPRSLCPREPAALPTWHGACGCKPPPNGSVPLKGSQGYQRITSAPAHRTCCRLSAKHSVWGLLARSLKPHGPPLDAKLKKSPRVTTCRSSRSAEPPSHMGREAAGALPPYFPALKPSGVLSGPQRTTGQRPQAYPARPPLT